MANSRETPGVNPPITMHTRQLSRSESLAKLMPSLPFQPGGEYFSPNAGWQQRLAYTVTLVAFFVDGRVQKMFDE